MQKQFATAFIPYEPLDKVKLKGISTIFRIREIRMIQYVVAKKVVMEVELTHAGNNYGWSNAEQIEKRLITKKTSK